MIVSKFEANIFVVLVSLHVLRRYYKQMRISKPHAYILVAKVSLYTLFNRSSSTLFLIDKTLAEIGANPVYFSALKGIILWRAKRYKEALVPVAIASRNDPESAVLLSLFLTVVLDNSKSKDALSMYNELLTSHEHLLLTYPNSAELWNNHGVILLTLRRYDEALESVNKALTINPRNAHMLSTKGEIYVAMGQYEEGLLWLLQAIRRGNKPAWKYAAVALHELGREGEAQRAREIARKKLQSR